MTKAPLQTQTLRIAALKGGGPVEVLLEPDAGLRRQIADELGIRAVRKLRLAGRLEPIGGTDWRLDAMLGATVVQDCVVTLDPVTTRIDEPVIRSYLADPPGMPEGEEAEMPEDDTIEPLPATLDLAAVMIEALALALPPYPHADGVAPIKQSYSPPGTEPIAGDEVKPFGGLADLRDRLGKKDN